MTSVYTEFPRFVPLSHEQVKVVDGGDGITSADVSKSIVQMTQSNIDPSTSKWIATSYSKKAHNFLFTRDMDDRIFGLLFFEVRDSWKEPTCFGSGECVRKARVMRTLIEDTDTNSPIEQALLVKAIHKARAQGASVLKMSFPQQLGCDLCKSFARIAAVPIEMKVNPPSQDSGKFVKVRYVLREGNV